jgi:hypothetical protein
VAAARAEEVFAWAGEERRAVAEDGVDGDAAVRMFGVLDTFETLVFNRRGSARNAIARACERAMDGAA